jgi:iron complex transport system substrate-binding protein
LVVADSIKPFAVDGQRAFVPRNQMRTALEAADVLIWTTDSPDDQQALLANADVAALRAHSIFTTKEQAGAIAFASPLSYPLVADQLPQLIAKIVGA